MDVTAAYVTVNCNQLQSGSSGFKSVRHKKRQRATLTKIQYDTCTLTVNISKTAVND